MKRLSNEVAGLIAGRLQLRTRGSLTGLPGRSTGREVEVVGGGEEEKEEEEEEEEEAGKEE